MPRQQTISSATQLSGVGLHCGAEAHVRFSPAPADAGVRFVRTDLENAPEIVARLDHVVSTERGTTLGVGEARVATVEHVLAATAALRIDNLLIEIDGPEVPILDGSFSGFADRLLEAGLQEQDAAAKTYNVSEPLSVDGPGGASYVVAPQDVYRVAATIEFDHPVVGRQFASFSVTPEAFQSELARARTFGFMREAEALRARGLAVGATLENAIILDDEGVASGALRYGDEFVRHKIGDVIGDLALLQGRVRGFIVAERPSHAGNVALAQAIQRAARRESAPPAVDINTIMQYLPHRYPMLLVDRILEFQSTKRIVGLKNVSINEPFFQGHYPNHPVMPGVLVIEAMAQVGGLLLMDAVDKPEDKVVYFMSLDNVKWRRPVIPGDQIRFEVEMLQFRRQVCRMKGVGIVDGQVAAEAEMMARVVDR